MRRSKPCRTSGPAGPAGKPRSLLWAAALVAGTAISTAAFCYFLLLARPPAGAAADPRTAEVEESIRRYFHTWSSQDIDGYGDCFRGGASIQFIDEKGKVAQYALGDFLAIQNDVFRAGRHEIEEPESIEIRFEGELARAVVRWKLSVESRESFGYDHCTLVKSEGKWKIVNLVWYVTSPHPSNGP